MKLKDIPFSPAYVVCHDEYDRGAMEVWPCESIESAKTIAQEKQTKLDNMGLDGCHYRAYIKLPRVKVYKYHEI
jgi:hypothetical protein